MPKWADVLKELESIHVALPPGPLDILRRRYLKELSAKTGRNVIAYYSGFLQPEKTRAGASSISDADINAFMNCVHGLKRAKGLDLILHTPGGSVTATEAIVNYLHAFFGNDVRCFVPQIAMSGGTMIACACTTIFMGKQSSIGPIDPQLNGLPAYGVIEDFDKAAEDIAKNPARIPIWQAIFAKIMPSAISECRHAIELSSELATEWLTAYMFAGQKDAKKRVKRIVDALNNHRDTKAHDRHINCEKALQIGLNVTRLEDDQDLQDLALTLHHAYIETFNRTNACKIVENQEGTASVVNIGANK